MKARPLLRQGNIEKNLGEFKLETPELTTEQKGGMVETLEQVKEECWRGNVLSVVMFVGYKDGSQGEFFNGLVNPESVYAILSKAAHRIMTDAIALEDETTEST